MARLYYTAPSDALFEDMKAACIAVWRTKGNDGGYADEKVSYVEGIANIKDNFMTMFAMFDKGNQRAVVKLLNPMTVVALHDRLVDGGNPAYLINEVLCLN